VAERKSNWKIFALAVVAAGLGELFLIGLEPSPARDVIIGFLALIVHVGLLAGIGSALGVTIALLVRKTNSLDPLLALFWLFSWLSQLAMWALPYWTILGVASVASAAAYYYLNAKTILKLEKHESYSFVEAEVLLQAILTSLVIQLLDPYGFKWFLVSESTGSLRAALVVILIAGVVYLLGLLQRDRVEFLSRAHSTVVLRLGSTASLNFFKVHLSITLLFLGGWEILGRALPELSISYPSEIVDTAVRLLIGERRGSVTRGYLWGDIAVSLTEIVTGLICSVCLAFFYCHYSLKQNGNSTVLKLLPLVAITPMLVVPFFFVWGVLKEFWLTVICVAHLSLFPSTLLFWGLKDKPLRVRASYTLCYALPFAFIGMLIGETFSASSGIGFALTGTWLQQNNIASVRMFLFAVLTTMFATMLLFLRLLKRAMGNTSV
jgi:hypothetical protein